MALRMLTFAAAVPFVASIQAHTSTLTADGLPLARWQGLKKLSGARKAFALEFIRLPFNLSDEGANFSVKVNIEDVSNSINPCKQALYITKVQFSGGWLGKEKKDTVKATMSRGKMTVLYRNESYKQSFNKQIIGSSPFGDIQLRWLPGRSGTLEFGVGQANVTVQPDIQRSHFFLNMQANGLTTWNTKIGGLLGQDDHKEVSEADPRCV